MSNVILKVDNLSKRYKDKVALDHVSFEIQKGKIYGFIGENGAGKTTTIRSITGLSSIDEGNVELFGLSDSKGLQEARKKMGCLVERPILMLNESAFYNLKMQQTLFGKRDDERINNLLDRVGLGDVKQKKVKNFSLGMKQRLGIALSLINNPELIILDEPVNGLDPMGMVEIRKLLTSLCVDDGITIIISSHILTELYQLVTDYIIISNGKIIDTLSKEQLDDRCSSYVVIETEHKEKAIEVLNKHNFNQVQVVGNEIRILGDVSKERIAKWMFDEGILLTTVMKYEKSLEEYYMELLGRK
ncbi:MAG: ABC transporter ATP-binding protein [Clostridia bacterium]|nr:ABC transporter ATP-binding protein [Clostridia bacterium]